MSREFSGMSMAIRDEAAESGFTLLEIMLVIVIMAVTAMMVAPSYFSAVSASLDDEGKRLAQVLRLADEEVTLSGNIFRIRFRQHSYQFQSADQQGVWQTLQNKPYQQYHLPDGFQVSGMEPVLPLKEETDAEKEGVEAVLGDVVFAPEGIRKIVDIMLSSEPAGDHQITVQIRPGPGGIAVKKDENEQKQ